MADQRQSTEPHSLWNCLIDGDIVSFDFDLTARKLTVIVDSPYHWDFHKLPTDTRFRIEGDDIRIAEVFDFVPWLGAVEPSSPTASKGMKKQERVYGTLFSADWKAFIADLEVDADREITSAEIIENQASTIFELGIVKHPDTNYRTVRIHAAQFRFYVGDHELSMEAFQEFGAEYWNDFQQRSKANRKVNNV